MLLKYLLFLESNECALIEPPQRACTLTTHIKIFETLYTKNLVLDSLRVCEIVSCL